MASRNLYRAVLLRCADPAGLNDYAKALANGMTVSGARQRMLQSTEFREVTLPARQLIEETYRDFVLRAPSQRELVRHLANLRRHLGSEDRVREVLRNHNALQWMDIRPFNVEMDITNQCNIRCVMCYFSKPEIGNRSRRDVTEADYERLAADLFPLARRLSLTLGTEPLIHRDFVRFAAIAKSKGIPKVYVNTNAVLLTEHVSRKLIEIGFDAINVSLDAGTPRTFDRVRPHAGWNRVLGNLRRLRDLKLAMGSRHPELSLSFVMMRSTIEEVPAFLHLAASLGAHGVHLTHLVPYSGLALDGETLDHDVAKCNRILEEAFALSAELDLQLRAPRRFESTIPASPVPRNVDLDRRRHDLQRKHPDAGNQCCPFPWHFVGIREDGTVQPCGWWYTGEPMGNVYREGFRAVWLGDPWSTLREDLTKGRLAADCIGCPATGLGNVDTPASFSQKNPFTDR